MSNAISTMRVLPALPSDYKLTVDGLTAATKKLMVRF